MRIPASNFLVYIALLVRPMVVDSSECSQARSCPLGLYCPVGYNCSDTSQCVEKCYMINAAHQGNSTSGRCEDVSVRNDVWLDSSQYEVFIYRQLEQNQSIINISLVATNDLLSSTVIGAPENITFNLLPFLVDSKFYVVTLPISVENSESGSVVLQRVAIVPISQTLPLGDYEMTVQVVWQDKELVRSDLVVHVVDPLPIALPAPVTCVQFESANYSVSTLDFSLSVTLVLSGQAQNEPFDVFVVAKDELSADSMDFIPGWYIATFLPGSTSTIANGIPILNKEIDNSTEQFSLELYIPGASYELGVQKGMLRNAVANIIEDVTEEFVLVGENIISPEGIRLIIDCGHLINNVGSSDITWRKDGQPISAAINVILNNTSHQLIITQTLLSAGNQLGTDGNYSCTVCSDNGTCLEKHSISDVCESPRLIKEDPITLSSGTSLGVTLHCGQNLCLNPKVLSVVLTCRVQSGDFSIYKDNKFLTKQRRHGISSMMFPDNLGKYNFVANDTCGVDTTSSVLSLCDPVIVYFNSTMFIGSEASGNITISLGLRGNMSLINGDITVTVLPSDQLPLSAEGNGVDYTSTPINATFIAGTTSTTIDVPVTIDNIVERNESLQLVILLPAPAKYAVEVENPSMTFATIIDSSNSSINFIQSSYATIEGYRYVQIGLVLSNPVSFDFALLINHLDMSAIGGIDYSSGPYTVIFPAGLTSVLFNISINDDNINEENEQFKLTIATTQQLPNNINFGEDLEANVVIEDNDALIVSFSQSQYSVGESIGQVQLVLFFSNPSSTNVTVQVISEDITAIGNVDYTTGPYSVVFSAGTTSALLNIPIHKNLVIDAAKQFSLSIVLSSKFLVGNYSQTLVTIIDDNAIYCNQTSGVYFGQSITWERTLTGIVIEKSCTGNRLAGTIKRRCSDNGNWLSPVVACVHKSFKEVTDKLETITTQSLSTEEKVAKTNTISKVLANITAPQNESYFPQELSTAVNVLSAINNITKKVIEHRLPNDTFFKDTTKVLNNLLSRSNEEGWQTLQEMSPEVNQMLLRSSENLGKILAQTLNNETNKTLEVQENIVVKTEIATKESIQAGKSMTFPNEDDNLATFGGQTTKIILPNNLLKLTLSNSSSDMIPIVTLVFRNLSSILPNTTNNGSDPATSVVSVQLPNPVTTVDDDPIVLQFNVTKDENAGQRQCVFYDYELKINNSSLVGGWSGEGVTIVNELSNDTFITCHAKHLTSFAVLVSAHDERPPSPEDKALSIISYIGCAISLVFLIISIIILSYVLYGKPPNKRNQYIIHINLCIALALGLVVFVSGIETAANNDGACKFVAALLQYLFISAFCWMLCEGVMLYMMLVTVFGNKLNHYLFFLALGWGPAAIIVAISLGTAHEHYGTDYYCWIKSDDGAIAAFIVPIGTIILINCVFFAITLRVIYKNRSGNVSESKHFDPKTAKELLKAAVFLLPLLGMTWIIGILAVNNETYFFAWIFAILNSLQGLFIFIFHVLRNKEVAVKCRSFMERYNFWREGNSFYDRLYGSKRSSKYSVSTYAKSSRESRSSTSEMLPSQSGRKVSTDSIDSDVFTSSTLKKSEQPLSTSIIEEEPISRADADVLHVIEAQDGVVTYNKEEEEIKVADSNHECVDKKQADEIDDNTA